MRVFTLFSNAWTRVARFRTSCKVGLSVFAPKQILEKNVRNTRLKNEDPRPKFTSKHRTDILSLFLGSCGKGLRNSMETEGRRCVGDATDTYCT